MLKRATIIITKVILFCTILFGTLNLYAQFPDLKFEHFLDENGFNQNTVRDLIQDKDGYIWIGTPNGLYQYDGYKFKLHINNSNDKNSLIDNSINVLKLDANGNIIIGTTYGLCKFDRLSERFIRGFDDLNNHEITAINEGPDNSLLVGTESSGLYCISENKTLHLTSKDYKSNGLGSNSITAIVMDKFNVSWVGTKKGLYKIILKNKTFSFEKAVLPIENIEAVYVDDKNEFWIGDNSNTVYCIQQNKYNSIDSDSYIKTYIIGSKKIKGGLGTRMFLKRDDHTFWIAMRNYGLVILDSNSGEYKIYKNDPEDLSSLFNNRVRTVLVDSSNVLWVGTGAGGLHKADLNRKKLVHITYIPRVDNSLSNAAINAITEEDENSIWVATENGLNLLGFKEGAYSDPTIEQFYLNKTTNSELTNTNAVTSLIKYEGDYWIAQQNTVSRMHYDKTSGKPKFYKEEYPLSGVYNMLVDSDNTLWLGSLYDGLVKWKKEGSEFPDYSNVIRYNDDLLQDGGLSSNSITALYEDKNKNLWVGTRDGGLNLRVKGKNSNIDTFINYKHNETDPNTLSHNSVFSILQDRKGVYWIGTFGGGLNKMTLSENTNQPPVFEHYKVEDGLANNAIYGILEDDLGKLWLSTDNGISCFDSETEKFKNYDTSDGLQSNNFRKNSYYKSYNGHMFFGGLKGLNIFSPNDLVNNKILPKVHITGIKINELPIKAFDRLEDNKSSKGALNNMVLKYDENFITIEFSAMHFAAPKKNKFKYKLEGLDKDWIYSRGLNFAHYTNLSHGDYIFRVKASNNDGLWSDEEAVLKLEITPPYWLNAWAYVIYSLIFMLVLYGVKSYFLLKRKNLEAQIKEIAIEKTNDFKLQFFTNISHDFKTPITLILNPIEELLEKNSKITHLKPKLEMIHRNANYLLRLVNQLMEFRKIEIGETRLKASEGNIIDFVKDITSSFKGISIRQQIKLEFESEVEQLLVWFDWDKLEKVLRNLLSNAFKSIENKGVILIRVSKIPIKDVENSSQIRKSISKINEVIRIEVQDNGRGIAESQLENIFQRFYQVEEVKKSQNIKSGSGIGLAIAKDLVELHYGNISVKSKEGQGSVFIIDLPLGKSHLTKEEMIEDFNNVNKKINTEKFELIDKNILEETILNSNNKNTILIIDDNKDIRTIVKEGLEDNYQMLEAENGKDAFEVALKEMPDLIITDVLMPIMDGIELTKKLKSNIRTCHIPVIMLTALSAVEHRIKGVESGAEAYLPKPFNIKLLKVQVNKLLENRALIYKHFQVHDTIKPHKIMFNSIDQQFLINIMELLEKEMANESYWVDELAADMNTSRSTFFRKLKKLTGQAPNDFMRMIRLKRAAQLLQQNQLSVAEVCYLVGFSDPNYFGKCFRKLFGQPPSKYQGEPTLQ